MKSLFEGIGVAACVLFLSSEAAFSAAKTPSLTIDNGVLEPVVKEDRSITIPITASHGAGATANEVLSVVVTGINSSWGAFSSPNGTYDSAHGLWTVTLPAGQNLSTAFTFTPAPDSDIDLAGMHATATASEPRDSTSASASTDFNVVADAVADVPTISAANVAGAENQPLFISLSGAVTDTDGSESVTGYELEGISDGFTFNHGINEGAGTWSFAPGDISGLSMVAPLNFSGSLDATAVVLSAETNLSGVEVDFSDNTNSAATPLQVTWLPEPSATISLLGGLMLLLGIRHRRTKFVSLFGFRTLALLLGSLSAAHAGNIGINMELDYYSYQDFPYAPFYAASPALQSLPSAQPNETFVESPSYPLDGPFGGFYSQMNGGQTSPFVSGSHGYSNFATYKTELSSNGWILTTDADTASPHAYQFNVDASAIGEFGIVPAAISAGLQGATFADGAKPTFTWAGPAGFDSINVTLGAQTNPFENQQVYGLSPAATSLQFTDSLTPGDYYLDVYYIRNISSGITATTPLDANSSALPNWSGIVSTKEVQRRPDF